MIPQVGETWWSVGPWTLMAIEGRFGRWRTPTPLDAPTGWHEELCDLEGCAAHWIPPGPEFEAAAKRQRRRLRRRIRHDGNTSGT